MNAPPHRGKKNKKEYCMKSFVVKYLTLPIVGKY